jgi:hypothetical protein
VTIAPAIHTEHCCTTGHSTGTVQLVTADSMTRPPVVAAVRYRREDLPVTGAVGPASFDAVPSKGSR